MFVVPAIYIYRPAKNRPPVRGPDLLVRPRTQCPHCAPREYESISREVRVSARGLLFAGRSPINKESLTSRCVLRGEARCCRHANASARVRANQIGRSVPRAPAAHTCSSAGVSLSRCAMWVYCCVRVWGRDWCFVCDVEDGVLMGKIGLFLREEFW